MLTFLTELVLVETLWPHVSALVSGSSGLGTSSDFKSRVHCVVFRKCLSPCTHVHKSVVTGKFNAGGNLTMETIPPKGK